jgi:hypothetical protein
MSSTTPARATRRKDRWTGTTAEQRRAATQRMREVRAAKIMDRKIDQLIAEWGSLSESQKAKFSNLVNGGNAGGGDE